MLSYSQGMSHKEANHSSHAQFGTGEEAKGWSPRAHAQPGTLSHTLQNHLPCVQGEDESHITVRKMDIVEYKQNIYRQQNQIASMQHIITLWSSLLQDMEKVNCLNEFKKYQTFVEDGFIRSCKI